jgi:hypothetical protein
MLKGVLKRFYEASEAFIEIKEGEFSPEEFTEPLPLIVKVVLVGRAGGGSSTWGLSPGLPLLPRAQGLR